MAKNVLLLGAGATTGSGGTCEINGARFTPPVDNNFFETVSQHAPDLLSENNRPFLRTLLSSFDIRFSETKDFSGIRLEQVWSFVDLCFKHFLPGKYTFVKEHNKCNELIKRINQGAKDSHHYYQDYMNPRDINKAVWLMLVLAGWEMRTLISDVLGRIIVPSDNNFLKLFGKLQGECKGQAIAVITFNYDLALEKSLDLSNDLRGRWHYPFIFSSTTRGEGVKIIKLHGSLNWKSTGPNLTNIDTDYLLEPVPQKINKTECSQAAIIPPTALKEEINLPKDQPPILQGLFNSLWRLALEEISSADNLIIIGYSFPLLDAHADWLFRIATSGRSKFQEVIYCYKNSSRSEDLERKVRRLFPARSFTGYYQGFDQFVNSN